MKKYLSLLLALLFSVGILAGCAPNGNLPGNTDTNQSRWPESTEFPPSDNSHKYYCNATMDSPFLGDYVSVTLMPYASEKEYTPEDFPECEFTEIERKIYYPDDPKNRYVTLTMILAHPSKENALEAVKLLEKRPDVYYARPDYYVKPEAAPTDNYYTDGTQK